MYRPMNRLANESIVRQLVRKIGTVGFDDFLVPVAGVFQVAFHGLEIEFITVYEDEAVAFSHTFVSGDQIDCTPWVVTKHLGAIGDCFLDLSNVLTQVFDAVWVMDFRNVRKKTPSFLKPHNSHNYLYEHWR